MLKNGENPEKRQDRLNKLKRNHTKKGMKKRRDKGGRAIVVLAADKKGKTARGISCSSKKKNRSIVPGNVEKVLGKGGNKAGKKRTY